MRNEDDNATFEAEQEILAILSRMRSTDAKDAVSAPPASADKEEPADPFAAPTSPDNADTEISLILGAEDRSEDEKKAPRASRTRAEKAPKHAAKADLEVLVTDTEETNTAAAEGVSPFARIGNAFRGLIPKKGHPASEIVRKCMFLLSLTVFLCSLGFLTYYMVLEPSEVNKENDHYASLYNDTAGNENAQTNEETTSIKPSFRQLYSINKDIAGWLAFNSADSDKFLSINLPVVWCGNNDTYLSRGFDGKYSRSGTLFFEQSNVIRQGVSNKVSIIYGHNMASGAMFAPLNKLIGNVYRARAASVITMETLYDSNQYKVFAVIVSDEGAETAHRFGYLRTSFADDNDFMAYVDELRAHSLFDYPVDVLPSDELLILSTCTNKSQVKVADGRLAVIARRVREGESATTDTVKIVKNDDVIMPYAWYTAQNLTPHAFYTRSDYEIPSSVVTGSKTTTAGTSATTTDTANTADTTVNTTATTTAKVTNAATTTAGAVTTTAPTSAATTVPPTTTTAAETATTTPTAPTTTATTTPAE